MKELGFQPGSDTWHPYIGKVLDRVNASQGTESESAWESKAEVEGRATGPMTRAAVTGASKRELLQSVGALTEVEGDLLAAQVSLLLYLRLLSRPGNATLTALLPRLPEECPVALQQQKKLAEVAAYLAAQRELKPQVGDGDIVGTA